MEDMPIDVEAVVSEDGPDVNLGFALPGLLQFVERCVGSGDVGLVVLVVMEGHYLLRDMRF
jgi:riboflavin synthase